MDDDERKFLWKVMKGDVIEFDTPTVDYVDGIGLTTIRTGRPFQRPVNPILL